MLASTEQPRFPRSNACPMKTDDNTKHAIQSRASRPRLGARRKHNRWYKNWRQASPSLRILLTLRSLFWLPLQQQREHHPCGRFHPILGRNLFIACGQPKRYGKEKCGCNVCLKIVLEIDLLFALRGVPTTRYMVPVGKTQSQDSTPM